MALLLFPGILGAPVLLNLLPADLSILPRNQHGARCSRQKLRTRALAQKPGTDHDFFGKFGADLCGPEHLAKNPFPAEHGFLGKTGADLRGP